MNSTKARSQFGSGDAFSDWAAVIIAALLFVRTADVLAYFSPPVLNEIIGTDVAWLYGGICAFWIEGVALAYHFSPRAQNYTPAKIVKWVLLSISGVCQIFDGRLITGTLANMPPAQKLVFEIGVPVLPLIVLILLFFVGRLPNDDYEHQGWHGAKNVGKGLWTKFWEGEQTVTALPAPVNSSTNAPSHALPPAQSNQIDPAVQARIDEAVRQALAAHSNNGGQQGTNF